MRQARWMFTAGTLLLVIGGCNISLKPAGIVIGLGLLFVVGAVNSFLGGLSNGK